MVELEKYVRLVEPNDADLSVVEAAFEKMLCERQEQDFPIAEGSSEWFTDNVFAPGADRGDGPFILDIPEVAEKAVLFWVVDRPPYGTNYASAVSYGQYIPEEMRRKGVHGTMIGAATRMLRTAGVKKVYDWVPSGMVDAATAKGFKISHKVAILDITPLR